MALSLPPKKHKAFKEYMFAIVMKTDPLKFAEAVPNSYLAGCIRDMKFAKQSSTTLSHGKTSNTDKRFAGICFKFAVAVENKDEDGKIEALLNATEILLCEWKWLNIFWVVEFLADVNQELMKEFCGHRIDFTGSQTSFLRKEIAMEINNRYGMKYLNIGVIIGFINNVFETLREKIKITPPMDDFILAIKKFVLRNSEMSGEEELFVKYALREHYDMMIKMTRGKNPHPFVTIARKLSMPEKEFDEMYGNFKKLPVHPPSRVPTLRRSNVNDSPQVIG